MVRRVTSLDVPVLVDVCRQHVAAAAGGGDVGDDDDDDTVH